MNDPFEEFTHNRCRIRIFPDDDPMSPADWDMFGTFVHWHRREHVFGVPRRDYDGAPGRPEDAVVAVPVYLYDHSGWSVSTGDFGDRWDSGQVGWLYATREQVLEWFGTGKKKRVTPAMRERARACLEAQVRVWDQYYRGDVWGYVVTAPDGEEQSVWGFYGLDDCRQEARAAADSLNPQLELAL